jgi:hypothetical protein
MDHLPMKGLSMCQAKVRRLFLERYGVKIGRYKFTLGTTIGYSSSQTRVTNTIQETKN